MSQPQAAAVMVAERNVREGGYPYLDGIPAEDVADLIAVLNVEQAQLVIGLLQASEFVRNLVASRLPRGTRELLQTHDAIDKDGLLTDLGVVVARHLAYAANRGPDPGLVASAEEMEANLVGPAAAKARWPRRANAECR